MKTQTLYRKIPHFQMSAAMILGGSSIIPAKILAGNMPGFSIHFLSLLFAVPVMLPVFLISGFKLARLNKKEFFLIILQAVSGVVVFRIAMVNGLRYLSAFNAGIITSLTPLMLSVFSVLFLAEKIRIKLIISILFACSGLLLINHSAAADSAYSVEKLKGFLWIFCAVCAEAGLSLFRKKSTSEIPSSANTFLIIIFSLVMLGPFYIFETVKTGFYALSAKQISVLLYYGIIATGFGYLLWGSGALNLSGCTIGLYSALLPLSSLVLSILVLKEHIYWNHFAGAVLTFGGVCFYILPGRRSI